MAPKQPTAGDTDGKRKGRQTGEKAPEPIDAQRPDRARRLVDVDPWASCSEGLTGHREEEDAPAGRVRRAGTGE